ncbi:MAG: right-handed parallel beta-helix repeat-containing protein [Anaerolineae bacterium]|nr:right-handed parallel beta-helix repeat-containing protein [Anaerolineae bacterium]
MWRYVKMLALSVGMGTAVLLACLFLLANESKAGGGVLCVVPPGEPTGPFTACDAVFTQIQDAVDTAVGGEEIWVAAGVYTDVHTVSPYNWTEQIVLVTKTLTIRGGYVAPFTEPPDFAANQTILDAQEQAHALFLFGQDVTAEGLHITGGKEGDGSVLVGGTAMLNQNVVYENAGFGVFIYQGSSVNLNQNTIRNNDRIGVVIVRSHVTLTENIVISNTGVLTIFEPEIGYAGGIYVRDSVVTMTANVISGNVAAAVTSDSGWGSAYGGGVYIEESTITMNNNTIAENVALGTANSAYSSSGGYGGGIAIFNSQGTLSHNVVRSNQAVANVAGYGHGGGLFIGGASSLTLTGNTIEANRACAGECEAGYGGGVHLDYGGAPVTAVVTLHDNLIQNNVANVSGITGFGGGLYVYGNFNDSQSIVHLTDNDILSNTGIISGPVGAGGGLFLAEEESIMTLSGNRVMSNSAAVTTTAYSVGGGLFVRGDLQLFNNNRFINNSATHHGIGYGGGFAMGSYEQIHVQMVNTILNDNQANTAGSAVAVIGADDTLSMQHATMAGNHGGDAAVWLAGYDIDSGEPIANSRLMMTNTILVSHTMAVSVGNGHTAVLNGVLWFNTPITVTAGVTATVSVANQLTGDPVFAPDGYHITAGSAAIRAGVPSGVSLDIDGEGRPSANPSLGVDEYWPFKGYFPLIFKP